MILLVDDEERYREHIARVLTKAGYEVLEAGDGIEALSLLEKSQIDLVISDILMPLLNGMRSWLASVQNGQRCRLF